MFLVDESHYERARHQEVETVANKEEQQVYTPFPHPVEPGVRIGRDFAVGGGFGDLKGITDDRESVCRHGGVHWKGSQFCFRKEITCSAGPTSASPGDGLSGRVAVHVDPYERIVKNHLIKESWQPRYNYFWMKSQGLKGPQFFLIDRFRKGYTLKKT